MDGPRIKQISTHHRSHKGCWTCKRKRIQCDEIRPACQRCTSRGITCEGYEIRLRWGTGVASRGRFSGAEKPVKESIPPRSKRRWDMRMKAEKKPEGDQQGQPIVLVCNNSEPVEWNSSIGETSGATTYRNQCQQLSNGDVGARNQCQGSTHGTIPEERKAAIYGYGDRTLPQVQPFTKNMAGNLKMTV